MAAPSAINPADLRIFVNVFEGEEDDGRLIYTLTQDLNDEHIRTRKGNVLWTKKDEVFKIKFILCDNTKLKLRFTDDDKGPFWIKEGSDPKDCPVSRFIAPGFEVSNVKKRRFTVKNPESGATKQDYVYRLRISEPDGTPRDFDPIIKNGGGEDRLTFFQRLRALFFG